MLTVPRPSCGGSRAGRNRPGGKYESDDTDRDIHEEDRAPAPTEEIHLDERTAKDPAGDRTEPNCDAEPGQCAMTLGGCPTPRSVASERAPTTSAARIVARLKAALL